ncbi:NADH dehydrogenase [ubiquinone] 1 alpha subcomplex subunit 4-like 2 [Austrofundulus limnaeus]|uniref:NADH dehydrogenase [ubiquinone] 1 alpha subcomplex subunit 4-like 2 n=1 Tax=Austrofundulus limnaeus TaxID=52670 RepID=A0A2I4AXB7_AUSLI|nr:PREDICTED: NADH dehydrogenase [ubiquinone] 1 alpha subcomplex subunit 4-like 2 [Austrofundulus limnaeus]
MSSLKHGVNLRHMQQRKNKNNNHLWLIPQFFITLGVTGAGLYLIRLARGPRVILWDKKNNPEPWNKLDPTYQYKFVAVNTDYKSLKKDRPDF